MTNNSIKGKFLTDFPDITKHLDLSQHKDLDLSKIQAGSNKIILNWICIYCKESYKKNINSRVKNTCCPKKECMLLKRNKTNNENFGWNPRDKIPERILNIKKEIPEPSVNDIEEWRNLSDNLLLSKYKISNLGRIKNIKTNYIFLHTPTKDGYTRSGLFLDNNTIKSFLIHVLVAKTFLENPENKPTVNHINVNKSDNRVINLEWATYSEQNYKENKNTYTHKGTKPINQYNLKGEFIKTWEKAIDAENTLKINRKNILKVLKGERKQSGGFIWEYKEIKIIENEIWKECPLGVDFDNVLSSNLGRIKIKNNNPTYGTLRESGYYEIKVYNKKDEKYKTFRVHRLVCMSFISNNENKSIVNHKDENRSNNKIENLEWMTNKENVNHSLDLNNRTKENKRSKPVVQIDIKTNKIIKEFKSISIASKETNSNYAGIYYCCEKINGRKIAGGFKWKYK